MKLSTFKRIAIEDFDSQYKDLISKLSYSINPFAEEVVQALDNDLNIQDNFTQKTTTISVKVDSSGSPTPILQFKTNLGSNCNGIQCVRAINSTNKLVYPTSQPFISYTESNGIITVNNITGLPVNNQFSLTLILYP